jgi:glutathione S-transferase
MDYVEARDARNMPGMRLALTMNVCGPWSEAAKYIYQVKDVPFVPVAQYGGEENPDLVDWTGHGNAPVAVWENEAPRTGWAEILVQAERLASDPALLPQDPALRAQVFGIANELCGEWGFGWCRRIMLFPPVDAPEDTGGEGMKTLRARYGKTTNPYEEAPGRVVEILNYLRDVLEAQKAAGSDYLVGDGLTAADIYWAAMSQMLEPMPEELNPITGPMREVYGGIGPVVEQAKHAILLEHRDMIFDRHLQLPLDFMDTRAG